MLAAIQGAKKVPAESAVHVLKGLRVFLDLPKSATALVSFAPAGSSTAG